jgi:hypothetical protein
MTKQDYMIIIKGLLMAKTLDELNPVEVQKLINQFDKLYQEAAE